MPCVNKAKYTFEEDKKHDSTQESSRSNNSLLHLSALERLNDIT